MFLGFMCFNFLNRLKWQLNLSSFLPLLLKQHYVVFVSLKQSFKNNFDGMLTCNRENGVSIIASPGPQIYHKNDVMIYSTTSHTNTIFSKQAIRRSKRRSKKYIMSTVSSLEEASLVYSV